MKSSKPTEHVIWAVDAFSDRPSLQAKTGKAIARFLTGVNPLVEPVCVLSPDQTMVPARAFASAKHEYRLAAETRLKAFLSSQDIPGLTEPTLLLSPAFSLRASVQTLLKYATHSNAQMVALSTRARSGVKRLFLGSFAEELTLSSPLPLLVVSPRARLEALSNAILFPTDFSDESWAAFRSLLPTARDCESKIILYYKVCFLSPYDLTVVPLPASYANSLADEISAHRKMAQEWAEEGRAAGVEVETKVDESTETAPEAILSAAQHYGVKAIALATAAGRVASACGASVGRQLMRRSPCPVWLLHRDRSAKVWKAA